MSLKPIAISQDEFVAAIDGSLLTNLDHIDAGHITTGFLSEVHGGMGSDISTIGTGLLIRSAAHTYLTRMLAGGSGLLVTNADGIAGNPTLSIDSTIVATTSNSLTLTNKTISGLTNTFSNIGNSSLVNSTVTFSASTGLSGGGTVSLGGTASFSVLYGTTSGTATQGNDTRLPPTPTIAGKVLYDTGTIISATAAGTSSQVLLGGATPAFGNVPSAALTSVPAASLTGTVPVAAIPTGIPATSIGTGTVDNTEFGYLDGVTSSIQTQLNGKQSTLTLPLSEANGGQGSDTSALTAGIFVKTAANTYVTRTLAAPAAGFTITNPLGTAGNPTFVLANDLAGVEGLASTGLAVRTATDTWTTRSLIAGTGTTVTQGDGVAGNLSVNVTYGTTSNTAVQGNDIRMNPTPSTAGKIPLDTGTGYSAITNGTSSQVLVGGSTPAFGNVPSAALTSVPAASLTGTVAEVNGGHGSDISAIGTGLLTRTATNTYVTRTLSSGTGTTVTNGSGVAGNPSVNVTYGTAINTTTQGNDTRLPPTPTAGGKVVYDTGSAYAETAAGTTGQILVSAGTGSPTWGTRGGAVISFSLNTGQSFAANGYIGIAGDGSSTINTNITPWRVPAAGTLFNLTVFGLANAPSTLHSLIYRATTASTNPTYSATTLDATVTSGTNIGADTTHSVSVNAGDLIVGFCNTAWAANGACINVMYTPT